MNMVIHCADVSNGLRDFEITEKWAIRVMNEFRA